MNSSGICYTHPLDAINYCEKTPDNQSLWQIERDVWTYVDTIPALQNNQYSYISSTLQDSSNIGCNYSIFKIVYHDLFTYYESAPDSGYSMDNIAPIATRTTITKQTNSVNLQWEEVEYGEFEGNYYPEQNGIWYKVHTGDTPDFICDHANLVTTVTNLEYLYNLTNDTMKFFKVIVSDKP